MQQKKRERMSAERLVRMAAALLVTAWISAAFAQEPILVVGHKNPDTDAIVSAMAVAALKSAFGKRPVVRFMDASKTPC